VLQSHNINTNVLNVERETEETEIETLNDYLDVIRAATNKNKLTIKTTTQCCSCENAKMFFILSITCPKRNMSMISLLSYFITILSVKKSAMPISKRSFFVLYNTFSS
jgi:hypothetical protein